MSEDQDAIAPTPARASASAPPRVRTLLSCDLVDSTALVERLGDAAAADLFRRHDRLARDLIQRHGGREIDKTDGYLVLFERPVEAVAFALAYQRALRDFDPARSTPLRARVGIHVGEVVLWENTAADVAAGAKSVDIEGLAKPVVARLMSLALPGQIVMSGVAFTLAQRADKELDAAANLRWLTHGRYRFKGVPAPMLVHEVGEAGHAPLQAPPSTAKATRDVPLWRRPGMLAIEGLALFAAIAIPIALSLRATPAIAFGERDWVVLGDVRNLTSEPMLSGALDSALRIGLEQSRYVNVVPNLQVQDALRRMERPGAALDRDAGVQLAAREGVRALLLPSLTEVGKDLRFSIEVVDPASGNTVQVEVADATGVDAVLPAMDRALASLRANLGESLKDIGQDNAPLAKITTANLDALRAYSQVDPAIAEGKYDEAIALLEHALTLDPEFAMALARLASFQILFLEQRELGLSNHARALSLVERLSQREKLLIAAMHAQFTSDREALDRWLVVARLYPDMAAARHNLGMALAFWRHEPERAIPHFQAVVDSSHPRRGEDFMAIALAQLMLGDVEAARRSFAESRNFQARTRWGHEHLLALMLAKEGEVPDLERAPALVRTTAAIARGDLDEAGHILAEAIAQAPQGRWTRDHARLALAKLALDAGRETFDREAFDRFVAQERTRLGDGDRSAELHLAYAAQIALRQGESAGIAALLDEIAPTAEASARLAPGAMVATARCLLRVLAERLACLDALPAPVWFPTEAAAWHAARQLGDEAEISRRVAPLLSDAGRGRALAAFDEMDLLVGNALDLGRARAGGSPAPPSPDQRR